MTRGKLTAYVAVASFVSIMGFFGMRSVSGPQLFPGDTLETRVCRSCKGTGKASEAADAIGCLPCAGRKECKVIIPGPVHPVSLRGSVRDLSKFRDLADAEKSIKIEPTETPKPFQPVLGAVRNAKLTFKSSSKNIELESNATGRYKSQIEPGEYTVKVEAEGFKPAEQKLVIPPRHSPIWQELGKSNFPEEDVVNASFVLEK